MITMFAQKKGLWNWYPDEPVMIGSLRHAGLVLGLAWFVWTWVEPTVAGF